MMAQGFLQAYMQSKGMRMNYAMNMANMALQRSRLNYSITHGEEELRAMESYHEGLFRNRVASGISGMAKLLMQGGVPQDQAMRAATAYYSQGYQASGSMPTQPGVPVQPGAPAVSPTPIQPGGSAVPPTAPSTDQMLPKVSAQIKSAAGRGQYYSAKATDIMKMIPYQILREIAQTGENQAQTQKIIEMTPHEIAHLDASTANITAATALKPDQAAYLIARTNAINTGLIEKEAEFPEVLRKINLSNQLTAARMKAVNAQTAKTYSSITQAQERIGLAASRLALSGVRLSIGEQHFNMDYAVKMMGAHHSATATLNTTNKQLAVSQAQLEAAQYIAKQQASGEPLHISSDSVLANLNIKYPTLMASMIVNPQGTIANLQKEVTSYENDEKGLKSIIKLTAPYMNPVGSKVSVTNEQGRIDKKATGAMNENLLKKGEQGRKELAVPKSKPPPHKNWREILNQPYVGK